MNKKSNYSFYIKWLYVLARMIRAGCKKMSILFILIILCSAVAYGQEMVNGTVTDAQTGDPLVGVNILVKGTTTGGITNDVGHYSLAVSSLQDTLRFSFIGFKTRMIPIDGRTTINIEMKTTVLSGKQLVVVGYGKEKEANLTGAVTQISGKTLNDRPTPNVVRSLQGEIAGVYINAPTGKPTDTYNPVVRGMGSIGAGGRALVLIDGVPGDLSKLNPNDIKSVSVLKDASSAAIYGSRGAFGVVLVTTKTPTQGEMQVEYNSSYSLNYRAVKPDLLSDGYLYAKNFVQAYTYYFGNKPTSLNTGIQFSVNDLKYLKKRHEDPSLPAVKVNPETGEYKYYGSTDFMELLFNNYNPSMVQSLTVSGGSKKMNYYVSGRYYGQHGIFNYSPDHFRQYNLRAKGNLQLLPWLKVSNNVSFSKKYYFWPRSEHGSSANIIRRSADEFNPLAVLRNPDGTFTKNAAITFESFIVGGNFRKNYWRQFRNTTNLKADFFDNRLTVHGNFTYKLSPFRQEEQRYPVKYSDKPGHFVVNEPTSNWKSETRRITNYMGANVYIDYSQSFGKHNLKAMVGYNYETTDRTDRFWKRNNMVNPNLPDPSLLTGDNIELTGGGFEWTTSGEFFRVNYNYAQRYLIEVNGRYDGSSKFPTGQQYGFFPSVSVGWNVSNEHFWKVPTSLVSNLKIRASFGSMGNGNVSPYQFLQTMPISLLGRVYQGGLPVITNRPNVIPNGLTWEKVTTMNFGLDLAFLKNRLSLTLDKYTRFTDGMFTQGVPIPAVFGAAVPKGNYADMKTPGWELSVVWQDEIEWARPFHYYLKFTLSDNHSIITKFNNPTGLIFSHYKGQRLGEIWGYLTDGLYQSEQEIANGPDQSRVPASPHKRGDVQPGDVHFLDLDGDDKITDGAQTLDDHGDLVRIGNKQPRYLFGFRGNFNWRHFSFSFFFQGVGKKNWWPGTDASLFWGQFVRPYNLEPMDVYNHTWRPDHRDAYFPRNSGYPALGYRSKELNSPSDRYLQNVAYIRLKNISIGYSLPKTLISGLGLSKLRVYLSGQNLWVYSPLFHVTRAVDPEAITSHHHSNTYIQSTNVGSQTDTYPILKTYTFGLNISF